MRLNPIHISALALACVLTLLPMTAAAQQGAQAQPEPQPPRVLIIGDSIYTQVLRPVAGDLADRARTTVRSTPGDMICNSDTVLENLDEILGDGAWDVIHFNVGLGDLVYRAPNMASFRVLPIHVGGVRATTPERYEANLRAIVARLKQTDAQLIWASTTPIRASGPNVFEVGSEVQYNAIAARVMQEQGVTINDMHTYVRERIDMDKPAGHNADPFIFDRQPVELGVVNAVLGVLGLPLDPEPVQEGAD